MTVYATSMLAIPVSERDHILRPATLAEYGDYQCPYCGQAYPVVEALQEQLGDQLRFVYRHFPSSSRRGLGPVVRPGRPGARRESVKEKGSVWITICYSIVCISGSP